MNVYNLLLEVSHIFFKEIEFIGTQDEWGVKAHIQYKYKDLTIDEEFINTVDRKGLLPLSAHDIQLDRRIQKYMASDFAIKKLVEFERTQKDYLKLVCDKYPEVLANERENYANTIALNYVALEVFSLMGQYETIVTENDEILKELYDKRDTVELFYMGAPSNLVTEHPLKEYIDSKK